MAVDGTWNITMSTPMGERNAPLTLKNAGGTLTGTMAAEGNSAEIFDGKANGDDVAWKVSITNPMPLTLEFTGKESVEVRTGNSGATYFTLNGQPLGAMGNPGLVETWLFGPTGAPKQTNNR